MFGRQYQHHQTNDFTPFVGDPYSSISMDSYYQNQLSPPPYTQSYYHISANDYPPQQVNAHLHYNQSNPPYHSNYPNEYMDSFYGGNHPSWFMPYQTPRPKGSKQTTNQAGFLSQFQAASGQIDVNKMLATVGQLANTVQQVTPMLKQFSNFIKRG